MYLRTGIEIDTADESYSTDLRSLIKSCLEVNPAERPNIKQVMRMPQVESRLKLDLEEYYKKQVTPGLTINSKRNVLLCKSANLEGTYKPIAMKSLKFNQNLIIILAVKQPLGSASRNQMNFNIISSFVPYASNETSSASSFSCNTNSLNNNPSLSQPIDLDDYVADDESKLFVFNEFGQLLKEFSSYLVDSGNSHKRFLFARHIESAKFFQYFFKPNFRLNHKAFKQFEY